MAHPRIVARTHYQVDEPIYLSELIRRSTSATRSDYPDRVAQHLATDISSRGPSLNVAAAGYGVDLARGLGLLTDQCVWTPMGHLLHLHSRPRNDALDSDALVLDGRERLLFLRVFLQGDGAAVLHLARECLRTGALPERADDWNTTATSLFVTTFEEYLKLATSTVERMSLRRELDRVRRGYSGRTGEHKLLVHLQAMYRMGLLERQQNVRRYEPNRQVLERLCSELPDVLTLEQRMEQQDWASVAAALLDIHEAVAVEDRKMRSLVAEYYTRISATGVPLCPLETIRDAIQIELLSECKLWNTGSITEWFASVRPAGPKDVRFHVDRRGVPAYIKLSDAAIESWMK